MNDKTKKLATAVLTRGYSNISGYDQLLSRNRSIAKQEWPLSTWHVVFHQGDISELHQTYIYERSSLPQLKFVNIEQEFSVRSVSPSNKWCNSTYLSASTPFGYKCMCNFWFSRFLHYLGEFDYVLRLDEDCLLKSLPAQTILQKMEALPLPYVCGALCQDHPDVLDGFGEFVEAFSNERGIAVNWSADKIPYTNCFLMDLRFFRRSAIFAEFVKEVTATDCIFVNRWGDHALWAVVLSLHGLQPEDTIDKRIEYFHGSHSQFINSVPVPGDPRVWIQKIKRRLSKWRRSL